MAGKKTKKRLIVWGIVLFVLAGAGTAGYLWLENSRAQLAAATNAAVETAQVARGDISVAVSATGIIESACVEDVVSMANGTVVRLGAKEGDRIGKGELLAELDNQDLINDITRAENDLKQQQINLSKQTNGSDKYRVDAPASGVVKNLKARVGEDLSVTGGTYGYAAVIVDEAKFYVTVTDIDVETTTEYAENNRVRVEVDGGTYEGKIKTINGYTQGTGANQHWKGRMEIEVASDIPSWEAKAKVYDSEDLYLGEEKIVYRDTVSVTGSGKVTSILVRENERVTRGQQIFAIDDIDVRQNVSSQRISVEQSKDELEIKRQQLDETHAGIIAPIDGVVTSLEIRNGETVSKNRLVATITSTDELEINVMIDELDIPKIKLGQSCTITVDALPGRSFAGHVTYIAAIGTTSNGVTNYEVRAALDEFEGVLVGMNATVKIHIDTHKQTLYLPIEAATQQADGSYIVYVDDPRSLGEGEESTPMVLDVGLINENYIEVLWGLEEGQTIFYQSSLPTDYFSQMFPMMNGNRGLFSQ